MIKEKTKEYFEKNQHLKVLFLFDAEGEYLNEIDNWDDDEIRLVRAEQATFRLKYQLEKELTDEKVLLYLPFRKPSGKELYNFNLLDILIANKELLIDDVADIMEAYHLLHHQRPLVKKYIRDLKSKKVQRTLAKILQTDLFDEAHVLQGLTAHYMGFHQYVERSLILSKLFVLALDKHREDFKRLLRKLSAIEGEALLIQWIRECFDLTVSTIDGDNIKAVVKRLKYNVLMQNIPEPSAEDPYGKLKLNSSAQLNRLNALMADWQQDQKLATEINPVFNELAADIKESTLMSVYGLETEYGYYTESLLIEMFKKNLEIIPFQPQHVLETLQNITQMISAVPADFRLASELLYHTANFYKLYNESGSYILNKAEDYIHAYVNKYQGIDYHFRKAFLLFNQLQKGRLAGRLDWDDFWSDTCSKYESFLKELNAQWLKCLSENRFNFSAIKVEKQYDFYDQYIKDSEHKTAVIISDALRYEAARELLKELHSDTKNQADISYMITSVPSTTQFGMANLLPNDRMKLENDKILIDGILTSGLVNRQKILKRTNDEAVAIQYEQLITFTQDEARALFKSKLVYIYHNVIDAIGDDRKTERQTFEAVERAIEDLKIIVKKIHSSWNVARVIITADHGFLYNPLNLPEAMYEKLPENTTFILSHNRYYMVSDEVKTTGYSIPLNGTTKMTSDMQVVVPKAVNRFKKQGAGVYYVHGGASLQELIVPVIISSRKREDVVEKVGFRVLNRNLKIVSGAIKIQVMQEQPLGRNIKERQILIGLYNTANELISNETDMILDSSSDSPTGRTKNLILNLSNKAGSISVCYLQIFDKADDPDKLNPLFKEKVINSSLMELDF